MEKENYSKIVIYLLLFISLSLSGCNNSNSETEKHPDFSKNIIDVSDKIVPVKTDLILGKSWIITVGKYLVLTNSASFDKGFVVFDKKTLKPIGSGGSKGQGPGQIIKYDNVSTIPNTLDNQSFYAFDASQLKLYQYNIDSMLNHKGYLPKEVLKMSKKGAITDFRTLNDSIFIGLSIRVTSKHAIVQDMVRFNYLNRKVKPFGYVNPESRKSARRTRASFALSPVKDKYVMAYHYIDLMTICDINGNLICNVYGPQWGKDLRKGFYFFGFVKIGKDHIVSSYLGSKGIIKDKNGQLKGASPSKLLIFDTKGNYQKALNIGEPFNDFCFDEENNRIIFSLPDRDEPLAYLDLKGILD